MKRDVIVDGNDYNGGNTENTQSLIEKGFAVINTKAGSWNTCMPKKSSGIWRKSGDFMKKIYDASGPIFSSRTRYLRAIDLQISFCAELGLRPYSKSTHKCEPTEMAEARTKYPLPPFKGSVGSLS